MIFLEHPLAQLGLVVFIALILASYKRLFLLFLFKKVFKFLPENARKVLLEKNEPAYFLLILYLVCSFGFQFIEDSQIKTFLNTPLKFIFFLGLLLFLWGILDILEDLLNSRIKNQSINSITKNILPYSKKLFKGLLAVVFGLIFLQNAGLNVSSLLASLGIGGLALALAAKETLAHFFGGLSVILDKPFSLGDWIVCDNIEGVVEDIGFRSTKIKTFYDSVITIPNSQLSNSTIDNLGKRKARRTRITLDIAYDTPPEKIEAFTVGLESVLKSNPHTRKDYYQCYFSGFGPHSLQIFMNFFLKVTDWDMELLQKQNIFLEILRLAKELEIDFAFPTWTLDIPYMPAKEPKAKQNFSIEDLKKKGQAFGPKGSLSKPEGMGLNK